jgi:hypothetical protein
MNPPPSRLFLVFQARFLVSSLRGFVPRHPRRRENVDVSSYFSKEERLTVNVALLGKGDAALSRITQSTDTTIRSCFVLLHIRG